MKPDENHSRGESRQEVYSMEQIYLLPGLPDKSSKYSDVARDLVGALNFEGSGTRKTQKSTATRRLVVLRCGWFTSKISTAFSMFQRESFLKGVFHF